ncbi:MAG TPA: hypothetical protein VF456_07710 [Vicinamibacterales bacterium]
MAHPRSRKCIDGYLARGNVIYNGSGPTIHSAEDVVDKLDPKTMARVQRLTIALLTHLSGWRAD